MRRQPAVAAAMALFLLTAAARLTAAEPNLTQLVKKIQPAVVTVIAYDARGQTKGLGSGFFINAQGHFITSHHVLAGFSRAEVKTSDGRRHPVQAVVAEDKAGDLVVAAIAAPPQGVATLQLTVALPEVGERVVVVGSPLGLEQSLSDGVVAGVRRASGLGDILQITAPISPGSSGSPVVNLKGEVVGVATLQSVEGQNLNFAVPGYRALALARLADGTSLALKSALPPATTWKKPSMLKSWRDFEVELGLKPDEPENQAQVYFDQGVKFTKAGEWEKAAEAYKQAIRLQPDFAEAHFALGTAYAQIGHY